MKIKDVLLAIAVIILTIFVTFYGINTIFPGIEYSDFCDESKNFLTANTQLECENIDGKWNAYDAPRVAVPEGQVKPLDGYCDRTFNCREEMDLARESRAQKVFFVALPLGILIIILGAFKFGLEAVGAGIMGGGVGTLIYGSGAFWPFTQDWVRFLLSLLGLAILIWFAYYFNKKKR